jgi:TetR/AcrR family transcriptional regulator
MAVETRHERKSEQTRTNLLDAALIEFSMSGLEGTSTRSIARRAGCHQPQINYHFSSKEALWEASVTHLFDQLHASVDGPSLPPDPIDAMQERMRRFVRFAAVHPELNRIMVAEAMADSQRLKWIVETHSRAAHTSMVDAWRLVRATGAGADIDERLVYHLFIGAASLLWANAPEAMMLDDTLRPTDECIELHANAVIALFFPNRIAVPSPTKGRRS